jgi:hypothetical protein
MFNWRSQTGYVGHGFESAAHGAFVDSGGGQHLIKVALDGLSDKKLRDQITPHVKPSDCYEKVMTWDDGSG